MSRAAIPRLCANVADVCTQKILVAAKAAGVELALEAPKGPVPELHKGDKVVKYTNAILRYVGRIFENSDLYGSTFMESAQVDAWLDWSEFELGDAQPPHLDEAVQALEKHLDNRVFLVGQRFTLADASVSCSIYNFQKQGKVPTLPTATKRWLGACTATPAFQSVLSSKAAPAASGASSGAASTGPRKSQGDTELIASYSKSVGGRTLIKRILCSDDKGLSLVGQIVSVCGWVRTKREGNKGKLVFASLNDGSCVASIQVVIDAGTKGFEDLKRVATGASMRCTGEIVKSQGKGQEVELLVSAKGQGHETQVFGGVDAAEYPLAKKEHSLEYLRELAHLRPRTQFISSVARVRSALAFATHEFFRSQNFVYVHTPCITAADCEGAGEMFQVTTLLHDADKNKNAKIPTTKEGKIDYSKDFFSKPSFLTVSGQLSVENYCCSLSSVYTFGPTFRAENSHTSRHLAEFWMIEPELAFADIHDDMDCAEDYLKYCVRYAYENHREDLEFFEQHHEPGLIKRLENLLEQPFGRVTYTEAVDILIKESPKANFQVPVEWGIDLGSEHERYLTEKVTKKPTIVYNYPKDIKAFYMRLNEDNKTVAAMDCLCPGIGEVIGGSQREERLDVLDRRLGELELDPQDYWWYRDQRKYGTVPHAGFGLGFERLIMLVTGVENIRDVIPYPRYPGHAEF